jgi:hypothetical protein
MKVKSTGTFSDKVIKAVLLCTDVIAQKNRTRRPAIIEDLTGRRNR